MRRTSSPGIGAAVPVVLALMLASSHALQVRSRVAMTLTHESLAGVTGGLQRVSHAILSARHHADTDLWHPRAATGESLLHSDVADWADVNSDSAMSNHAELAKFADALMQTLNDGDDDRSYWERVKSYVSDKADSAGRLINSVHDNTLVRAAEGLTSIATRLSDVGIVRAVLAAAFGIINGMLLGMVGHIRAELNAIGEDEACQQHITKMKTALSETLEAASFFFEGVIDSEKRHNENSLLEHVASSGARFFGSLAALLWYIFQFTFKCPPLRNIVGMVFLFIAFAVGFTLLLIAFPGAGWAIKLGGIIMTIIFGAKFAYDTAKKLVNGIADNSVEGTVRVIEAAFEFIGLFIAVFVLSGLQEALRLPGVASKFNSLPFARKFGLKFSNKAASEVSVLESTIAAAKSGSKSQTTSGFAKLKSAEVPQGVKTPTAAKPTGKSTTVGKDTGAKIVDDVVKPDVKAGFDKNAQRWRNEANGRFVKTPNGLKWDHKVMRWRDPKTGKFAKQPDNVWPKWDAKVQRWRDHQGRFAKSPVDKNIKWEANVQRFRDQTTGRFTKNPSDNHKFYIFDKGTKGAVNSPTKPVVVNPTKPVVKPIKRGGKSGDYAGEHYLIPLSDSAKAKEEEREEEEEENDNNNNNNNLNIERRRRRQEEDGGQDQEQQDSPAPTGVIASAHFEFDSKCPNDGEAEAAKAKAILGDSSVAYVSGHADTRGEEGYNMGLARERALASARALRQSGFEGTIKVASFGETLADEAKGHAYNRRVDYSASQPGNWASSDAEFASGEAVEGAPEC